MAKEIINLTLTELSLVDNPANPLAMAPIFKAQTSEGDTMTEVNKMSEEMDERIKAYMKAKNVDRKTAEEALMKSFDEVEKAKAENERLRGVLIKDGYVIKADTIEKKSAENDAEAIMLDGEKINKSDDRYELAKRLQAYEVEKQEAAIAKQASENLPNFAPEVAVKLMKSQPDEEVLAALKAADKLFESLTEEVGKTAAQGDMEDPNEKMNALAKAYAKEHKMTFAKAYSEVIKTDEGKELRKAIYKKD